MSDVVSPEKIINLAASMGVELSCPAAEKMFALLEELQRWNKAYNLTAIKDPYQMMLQHILDSLSLVPYINGQTILDWGTGAGFPGLPLAIFFEKKQFYLLDSVGKKVRFIQHVVHQLGLDNVSPIHARVEHYKHETQYDVIIARAVGSIEYIVQNTRDLLSAQGCFVLPRGPIASSEYAALNLPANIVTLSVPGIKSARHAIIIRNGDYSD